MSDLKDPTTEENKNEEPFYFLNVCFRCFNGNISEYSSFYEDDLISALGTKFRIKGGCGSIGHFYNIDGNFDISSVAEQLEQFAKDKNVCLGYLKSEYCEFETLQEKGWKFICNNGCTSAQGRRRRKRHQSHRNERCRSERSRSPTPRQ